MYFMLLSESRLLGADQHGRLRRRGLAGGDRNRTGNNSHLHGIHYSSCNNSRWQHSYCRFVVTLFIVVAVDSCKQGTKRFLEQKGSRRSLLVIVTENVCVLFAAFAMDNTTASLLLWGVVAPW